MLHHCPVDATCSSDEFLLAQLAVVVLVKDMEQAAGIRHSRCATRHRTRRTPAVRSGKVTVMAVGRTVVAAPGFRSTSVATSVMVGPPGLFLTVSTVFRSIRTVGQHDLRYCDNRQRREETGH